MDFGQIKKTNSEFPETRQQKSMVSTTHLCAVCNKVFNTAWYLRQHVLVVHGNARPFLCTKCGKSYRYSSNLYTHIGRTHRRKDQFKPGSKKGKKPQFLKRCHEMSNVEQREVTLERLSLSQVDSAMKLTKFPTKLYQSLFPCPFCSAMFPSKEYLQRHEMFHRILKDKACCPDCSETFASKRAMEEHVNSMHDCGSHVCEHCQGTFVSRLQLKFHLTICTRPRDIHSTNLENMMGAVSLEADNKENIPPSELGQCSTPEMRLLSILEVDGDEEYMPQTMLFEDVGLSPSFDSVMPFSVFLDGESSVHSAVDTQLAFEDVSPASQVFSPLARCYSTPCLLLNGDATPPLYTTRNNGPMFCQWSSTGCSGSQTPLVSKQEKTTPIIIVDKGKEVMPEVKPENFIAKPHVCSQCGKAFRRKDGLTQHKTLHDNIKPHKCPYCGHATRLKCNMRVHMRQCVAKKQARENWML